MIDERYLSTLVGSRFFDEKGKEITQDLLNPKPIQQPKVTVPTPPAELQDRYPTKDQSNND